MKHAKNATYFKSVFVFFSVFIAFTSFSQPSKSKEDKVNYKYNQYVMVTLKNGSEVPAVIASVRSTKQYYVRQLGGGKTGLVHRKHLRLMTKEEIVDFKRGRDAKKR